jgi:uncharacterized DUF497 family protein
MMRIVWDEPKRRANLKEHKLDFADAERFDWSEAMIVATYPGAHGGLRLQALGDLDGRLVSIVFAPLGVEAVSIISMRRASVRERRFFRGPQTED